VDLHHSMDSVKVIQVLVHFAAASTVCVHFCLFSIQSRFSVNCSFPSTKWSETCTTTRILLTSVILGTIWSGGCNMHFYRYSCASNLLSFLESVTASVDAKQNVDTIYSVSQKNHPLRGPDISHFPHKQLRIFNRFFTHLLHVPIYARLQIFIQLLPTLMKLCHIKRDYAVHIICAKCPKRDKTRAFRRLRKSLIALLIVVCGK